MHDQPKNIFIIDGNTEVYQPILASTDYKSYYSQSFQDAVTNILSKNDYDLIIIDSKQSTLRVWKILELIRSSDRSSILPVIVVFQRESTNEQTYAINAGADDFIVKPIKPEDLLMKIKSLIRRSEWNRKKIVNTAFNYQNSKDLSSRQLEILTLTTQGYSNKEIATLLSLSEKTIKTHMHTIFEKLCVSSRTQAAIVAIKEGLAS